MFFKRNMLPRNRYYNVNGNVEWNNDGSQKQ
jgi:hypothetical protein